MNAKSNQNQRRFPRRAAFIIAKYTVKEGTFRDIIKNIGATGIFVRTWRGIAEGQPIELQFPVFEFENQLQVTGMVVRSNPKGFSVVFDQPIEGLICKEGHFPE
ncbi:MAG: PilZ domain-containing protein, partial [Desulfosarcina sp.]|nr:PilZ domain-containing protein [Desulfosarcina sp.]MBC2767007.1 PilZ domain-containing protein [Desulfosarcina sp.]